MGPPPPPSLGPGRSGLEERHEAPGQDGEGGVVAGSSSSPPPLSLPPLLQALLRRRLLGRRRRARGSGGTLPLLVVSLAAVAAAAAAITIAVVAAITIAVVAAAVTAPSPPLPSLPLPSSASSSSSPPRFCLGLLGLLLGLLLGHPPLPVAVQPVVQLPPLQACLAAQLLPLGVGWVRPVRREAGTGPDPPRQQLQLRLGKSHGRRAGGDGGRWGEG